MSRGAAAKRLSVLPDSAEVEPRRSSVFPSPSESSAATDSARRRCVVCFGTGMEVVRGRGARRCACREFEMRQSLLEGARIPKRHEASSFASFQPAKNQASQMWGFERAFSLVREYPATERGLLFAGPVGVGKTHLAVAILRGLIEKGARCLFYECGSLLKEIQESYDPVSRTSEASVLAQVCQAEVLVLDELGASKPTEWALDTLAHVIGRRYNDKRLTIFTTNYTDTRHAAAETLEDRIGLRLRSRLFEMCQTVVIEGEDYRRRFEKIDGV
jgi:DNA replication protein DnaC